MGFEQNPEIFSPRQGGLLHKSQAGWVGSEENTIKISRLQVDKKYFR